MISQELLVDVLDDRKEAPVSCAEGQLRVRMPWRGNIGQAEQAPGQRFAHLRWIVVHRLEIDPGHSGEPVALSCGIEEYPPGRLRCAQRTVPAVLEREGLAAEQDTSAAGDRNAPAVGRIGFPHVEPGAGGPHRLGQDTASRAEPRDMKHVHVRAEELRLSRRRLRLSQRRSMTARHLAGRGSAAPGQLPCRHRTPVEHLPEPVPADSRVHASPMPVSSPAGPVHQPLQQSGAPGYLLFLTEEAARPLIHAEIKSREFPAVGQPGPRRRGSSSSSAGLSCVT